MAGISKLDFIKANDHVRANKDRYSLYGNSTFRAALRREANIELSDHSVRELRKLNNIAPRRNISNKPAENKWQTTRRLMGEVTRIFRLCGVPEEELTRLRDFARGHLSVKKDLPDAEG